MIHQLAKVLISIVIVIYLLGLALDWVGRWIMVYKPNSNPSQLAVFDIGLRAARSGTNTKTFLTSSPMFPALSIVWPLAVWPGSARVKAYRGRISDSHLGASLALRPEVLLISACGLVLATVCAFLTRFETFVWAWPLIILTLYALIAIVTKHVFYTVRSLPNSLRQSLMNPFSVF